MIHHVVFEVSDLERSGTFYDALLAPLGWRRHFDKDGTVGWGIAKPVFFVSARDGNPQSSALVSFTALGIAAVKASWESGVRAGGKSLQEPTSGAGGPGSGSYSAFLTDPDGHHLEVTVGSD